MIKNVPDTKPKLISAIQKIHVDKIDVKEIHSKNEIRELPKQIQDFYGNGSKTVSMILIRERS